MHFIFVFCHLIWHNMKMENKLKNINYLKNFIIEFSFSLGFNFMDTGFQRYRYHD